MDQVFPLADRQGSSNKAPLVSVVMPAFNVEQYIAEAIESILSQSFSDFELIIVNDGSSDRTLNVIEDYARRDPRICYRSNSQNLNAAVAANIGLTLARGIYIARMDADDIAVPQRLEKQVRFLESHPEVGVVGGAMMLMTEDKRILAKREYRLTNEAIQKRIFKYSPFCHASIMFRKSILDRVGLYDPRYRTAYDYDLFLRIGLVTKFANLPELLYWYRIRRVASIDMRNREFRTIEIRRKYFQVYGATLSDRTYNVLHQFSMYVFPSRFKAWMFMKVREFII
ncbi:MAG: glycosyltransferase [Candidatus Peribacteraceae bacterium]|nr:glycosyltransferase [Candidatus Peribacteraceae bacterium]